MMTLLHLPPPWASDRLREVLDASVRAGALVAFPDPLLVILGTTPEIVNPFPPEIVTLDNSTGRSRPPFGSDAWDGPVDRGYPLASAIFAPLVYQPWPWSEPRFQARDALRAHEIMRRDLWRAPAYLLWAAANKWELRRWSKLHRAEHVARGRQKREERERLDAFDAALAERQAALGRSLTLEEYRALERIILGE